jgi:ATP-binding cassette subfamily B protein
MRSNYIKFLAELVLSQKKLLLQLGSIIICTSLLLIATPYFIQGIVDVGISDKNMGFIGLMLISQFVLSMSIAVGDFVKGQIMVFIGARINLELLSRFWNKLYLLPMTFFAAKGSGKIYQSIADSNRVQFIVTSGALNAAFALFNFVILSFVLLQFDSTVFYLFVISCIIYFAWTMLFLSRRKRNDIERYNWAAKDRVMTVEILQGMQDIKLLGLAAKIRMQWLEVQNSLVSISLASSKINQLQQVGSIAITQGTYCIIMFIVANRVVEGVLTLGSLVAIQFVLGQLNNPLEQFMSFTRLLQDAGLSARRLDEVHNVDDESHLDLQRDNSLVLPASICIKEVNFKYSDSDTNFILTDINLKFPEKGFLGIVGSSGSGKSTLLKLLLKLYAVDSGTITIGQKNVLAINTTFWRSICTYVSQEGVVFNGTVEYNISISSENPDSDRIRFAARMANIDDFIETLPHRYETWLGDKGVGLSQGQKQRILLARAFYRSTPFLFLDEATSCLDYENESIILGNLRHYFKDRLVIVVAHRLETVRDADEIIVLHGGKVYEQGCHENLFQNKGKYFQFLTGKNV